nr:hypothetical protein [Tanacetum cinerariifolium]
MGGDVGGVANVDDGEDGATTRGGDDGCLVVGMVLVVDGEITTRASEVVVVVSG